MYDHFNIKSFISSRAVISSIKGPIAHIFTYNYWFLWDRHKNLSTWKNILYSLRLKAKVNIMFLRLINLYVYQIKGGIKCVNSISSANFHEHYLTVLHETTHGWKRCAVADLAHRRGFPSWNLFGGCFWNCVHVVNNYMEFCI